jgi:hypothetical protein
MSQLNLQPLSKTYGGRGSKPEQDPPIPLGREKHNQSFFARFAHKIKHISERSEISDMAYLFSLCLCADLEKDSIYQGQNNRDYTTIPLFILSHTTSNRIIDTNNNKLP